MTTRRMMDTHAHGGTMDYEALRAELRRVFNMHSLDAHTNTPDYILADMVTGQLKSYNEAMTHRDQWHRGGILASDIVPKLIAAPDPAEVPMVHPGEPCPEGTLHQHLDGEVGLGQHRCTTNCEEAHTYATGCVRSPLLPIHVD